MNEEDLSESDIHLIKHIERLTYKSFMIGGGLGVLLGIFIGLIIGAF